MIGAWQKGKVLKGTGEGRKIGFPTINLSIDSLSGKIAEGVYACLIRYHQNDFWGVLFYGPRLVKKERHPVLEIYIIDFYGDLYGKIIKFKIISFIRKVKNFKNMQTMKKEIEKDLKKTNKILTLAKKTK